MSLTARSSRRPILFLFLFLFLAVVAVRPSAQQGRTVGAAPGALLGVDFQAVTSDGKPVTDLKTEEVTLQIDGKPRVLKSLQFVDLSGPPVVAAATAPPPLPAPFSTNGAAAMPGRQIYLIIENETMPAGREQPTRDAITQFLTRLTPNDHVALVTVPHGGVNVDLTTDLNQIRLGLPKIAGMYKSGEAGIDATCRARDTLNALAGMLGGRAGTDAPIDFVFFTNKMVGFRTQGNIPKAGAGMDLSATEGASACEVRLEDLDKVKLAAAAAHAHMYVVQPEVDAGFFASGGTTTNNGSDSPVAGLESLVGTVNGVQLALGSNGGALNRIARESSGYYVATYEPDPVERNGSPHRVSVKVSRNDVTIRNEPLIIIDKPGAPGAKANAPSPKDMVNNSNVYGDLPIRMSAFVSRNSADPKDTKVKIISVTEAIDPAVKLSAASVALFKMGDAGSTRIALTNVDSASLARWPIAAAFAVPPGTYKVRVATVDTTGRSGSADYSVDAQITAIDGPLKLSGLALGTGKGAGFVPQLQFSNEPVATAMFELYGGSQGMGITGLDVEIAATETGPPLAKSAMSAADVAGTSDPDRVIFTPSIDIGALSPGDYIVRVTIAIGDKGFKGTARIMRTLRKVGG
jgi:hypothetical protein